MGFFVGLLVGSSVGERDGLEEGSFVGLLVGASVGERDGFFDGLVVGEGVGGYVGHSANSQLLSSSRLTTGLTL